MVQIQQLLTLMMVLIDRQIVYQLTIEQGTDYVNHVIVKKTDTGEFLVIIQNTSLSSISNADFSAILKLNHRSILSAAPSPAP